MSVLAQRDSTAEKAFGLLVYDRPEFDLGTTCGSRILSEVISEDIDRKKPWAQQSVDSNSCTIYNTLVMTFVNNTNGTWDHNPKKFESDN